MNTKTLEQLNDLKDRIERDISRSRMQDQYGLSNDTPLMKNYRQVQQEIRDFKPEETVSESVKVLDEKKIVVGSVEHMTHAVHAHHTGSTGIPNYSGGLSNSDGHPDYHFHHMGITPKPDKSLETNYLVVHKQSCDGTGCKDAHHFKIGSVVKKTNSGPMKLDIPRHEYDVKHVAKVM
jgi:hypothetical protein